MHTKIHFSGSLANMGQRVNKHVRISCTDGRTDSVLVHTIAMQRRASERILLVLKEIQRSIQ